MVFHAARRNIRTTQSVALQTESVKTDRDRVIFPPMFAPPLMKPMCVCMYIYIYIYENKCYFGTWRGVKSTFRSDPLEKFRDSFSFFFFFLDSSRYRKDDRDLEGGEGGEGKNDFRREFFGLEGGWREAQARQRYSISSYPPLLPVYFSGSTSPIGEFPSPPIFPPPPRKKRQIVSRI